MPLTRGTPGAGSSSKTTLISDRRSDPKMSYRLALLAGEASLHENFTASV